MSLLQRYLGMIPHVLMDSHSQLTTRFGEFEMFGFVPDGHEEPVVALVKGRPGAADRPPLVRIQSKCTTGEVFGSLQCDCDDQLHHALEQIASEGSGVFIYLDQEARGNGLRAKLQIYQWMKEHGQGSDEACRALGYPIDVRTYEDVAAILSYFDIGDIRLLTNNPEKIAAMARYGIQVTRVPIIGAVNGFNHDYLLEKQTKHHHELGIEIHRHANNGH